MTVEFLSLESRLLAFIFMRDECSECTHTHTHDHFKRKTSRLISFYDTTVWCLFSLRSFAVRQMCPIRWHSTMALTTICISLHKMEFFSIFVFPLLRIKTNAKRSKAIFSSFRISYCCLHATNHSCFTYFRFSFCCLFFHLFLLLLIAFSSFFVCFSQFLFFIVVRLFEREY